MFMVPMDTKQKKNIFFQNQVLFLYNTNIFFIYISQHMKTCISNTNSFWITPSDHV